MLTIAYFTCRQDPKWEWFVDSLDKQVPTDERANIELLFVDAVSWREPIATTAQTVALEDWRNVNMLRWNQLAAINRERFNFRLIPPKPCVWQGPYRLTQRDWFAASNARNTALVVAQGDYLVCVDDLSVLLPGWWENVKHAVAHRYFVGGAYKKPKNLVVTDGVVESYVEYSVDSRWNRGSSSGIVPWYGSAIFGCCFGIPLDLALAVNGFDEQCDGQGAEDYDFGTRVHKYISQHRPYTKVFYNRNMCTYEAEELHHYGGSRYASMRKLMAPDYMPDWYRGEPYSDHVMLRWVNKDSRTWTLGTPNLLELRQQYQTTGAVSIPTGPTIDWRDGTPLAEM